MPRKRVGVIGSGPAGQRLASAFSSLGYETKIGSRDPEKLKDYIAQSGGRITAGTFDQTATFGDIIVLSTHGEATESAIELAHPMNFAHKLVIDTSNPLDFSKGMPPGIPTNYSTKTLGEHVQEKLGDAKVVKCFNTVPNEVMFRPKFEDTNMLICGNDSDAKKEVTQILKEFGWAGSIDLGGIDNAKWLEALVPLWVRAALATGNYSSMFKFVQSAEPSTRR